MKNLFYLLLLLGVSLTLANRVVPISVNNAPLNSIESVSCDVCVLAVEFVEKLLQQNLTESEFEVASTHFCVIFNLANEPVCKGMVKEFGPTIIPIMEEVYASPVEICYKLHLCDSPEIPTQPLNPIVNNDKIPQNKMIDFPMIVEEGTGYFLQLTDIHADPLYAEGSSTDCGFPLCCRTEYGVGSGAAGKWGDYNCDIPFVTLDSMFSTLKDFPMQPDFIIYTGDSPPHDVWSQSKESVLQNIFNISAMLTQTYPKVPVFPVIGNHDTFPVDQFSQHRVDMAHHDDFAWIRNGLAEAWGSWLPANAQNTLKSSSYFSVLVRPGLRIISLNSQWTDSNNMYLLLKEDQQKNQSLWLQSVLENARAVNEKVYIMAHISLGAAQQSSEYAKDLFQLVTNYSDVISAQFYGHTHEDEFEVLLDSNKVPIGISYISPSVTTYLNKNPSFRFYKYNTTTGEVLDYYQYFLNLTRANSENTANWELEYEARSEYNLPDLSPKSWEGLVQQMTTNDEVWDKWWSHFSAGADNGPCEGSCRSQFLCQLGSSNPVYCKSHSTTSVKEI